MLRPDLATASCSTGVAVPLVGDLGAPWHSVPGGEALSCPMKAAPGFLGDS